MTVAQQLASARFFFHVVSGDTVILDNEGINLSVENNVLLHVVQAVENLQLEGFFASAEWEGHVIEISDEAGQTVLSFRLSAQGVEWTPGPLH